MSEGDTDSSNSFHEKMESQPSSGKNNFVSKAFSNNHMKVWQQQQQQQQQQQVPLNPFC